MDIYLWSCCSDSRQLLENKRGLFSIKTRWVEHSLEWEKKAFFFLQERESYPVTSYLDLDVLFGWTTHKPKHQHISTKRQEKREEWISAVLGLCFVRAWVCAVRSRGLHAVRIQNEALTLAVSPFLSVHSPFLPTIAFLFPPLCLCSGRCSKGQTFLRDK